MNEQRDSEYESALADATRDTAFAHLARSVNEPKPGSPESDERGCLCPIIDNHRGKGRFGTGEQHGWWINADCRLHNKEASLDKRST